MQLHYLKSVLLLSSHHRKVCAKVGSSCLLEDRYMGIPICNSNGPKYFHNLLSYALLYYETKLPFFGVGKQWLCCWCSQLCVVCRHAGGWWWPSAAAGLKHCLFHVGSGWLCWVSHVLLCGRGLLKGWVNSCERAEQLLMQKSLCSGAAVQRQLHFHRRKQTGLFSGMDSTRKLPPPPWALQGADLRPESREPFVAALTYTNSQIQAQCSPFLFPCQPTNRDPE